MTSRRSLVIGLAVLILVLALGGLVFALAGNDGRFGPWLRALSLPVALLLSLTVAIVLSWWWRRRGARPGAPDRTDLAHGPIISETLSRAADVQAKRAGEFIDRVADPERREQLRHELRDIQASGEGICTLNVVVFGTVSSGKTSLINALLGRTVGATEAVMGTTRQGECHTYELRSVDAAVYLTDTPGLGEAGEGGETRELEARALAVRSDLLLFVVDHDLIRGQYEPLIELSRLGKRSILVLNKKDLFPDEDLGQIMARLRQRLAGVLDPTDVVAVAAAPRPVPVRVMRPDGGHDTVLESEEPDIAALRSRIGEVLRRDGRLLHAANLLVRGRVLEQEARDQVAAERERQALVVVERYQWLTAGTVFANPVPALDVLAGGAAQIEMVSELARVFELNLSPGQARGLAGQMVKSVLKLGLVETVTSLVAGVFKRTFVGFAAGGAVQAVTMSYLTRVSGRAFIEYFRRGQNWGEDGIDAALLRQFQETSRVEFIQEFATQAVPRLIEKFQTGNRPAPAPTTAPTSAERKP
ncbi:MAG: DUF697 domain-containing protein [Isosphaeraceae bacterium]